MHRSAHDIDRAFTLVELLVVIAVISILAAMLLPALEEARRSALRASCAGTLRQWGSVLHMYADAHDGFLPYRGPANTHLLQRSCDGSGNIMGNVYKDGHHPAVAMQKRMAMSLLDAGASRELFSCPAGGEQNHLPCEHVWDNYDATPDTSTNVFWISSYTFVPWFEIYTYNKPIDGVTGTMHRISDDPVMNASPDGRETPVMTDVGIVADPSFVSWTTVRCGLANHYEGGGGGPFTGIWSGFREQPPGPDVQLQLYMGGHVNMVFGEDLEMRSTYGGYRFEW